MLSWLDPWLRIDPMLPKKYAMLRQIISRVQAQSGRVMFYINHGPGPINTEDTVRNHLGTSVFADGSYNDKILDIVLEFHADDLPLPELDSWAQFRRTETAGTTGPTSRVRRRRFVTMLIMALVGLLTFPLMIFSCSRGVNNGRPGGGFWGGML
jgi:hypothetical protein